MLDLHICLWSAEYLDTHLHATDNNVLIFGWLKYKRQLSTTNLLTVRSLMAVMGLNPSWVELGMRNSIS